MFALELITLLLIPPVLGWVVWRQQAHNERLNMNVEQAVAELKAIKDQSAKALGEIRSKLNELNLKIESLEEAVRNQELPQSVVDAIAAIKASSQELDDVVPDAPPVEEPPVV